MNILSTIARTPIFGIPVIMVLGIITLISVITTATIGFMVFKGTKKIPFRWHIRLAILSITLAVLHGLLGLSFLF
jgi:ABC-type proline/glycine betaine transport system permease subunit